jgi:hypothetical protein
MNDEVLNTLDQKQILTLRKGIHRAVDAYLDQFFAQSAPVTFTLSKRSDHQTFSMDWPDKNHPQEHFTDGTYYDVMKGNERIAEFLIAQTQREAWGKKRSRYSVFLQGRRKGSTSLYVLAEFVQCDKPGPRYYAAKIPTSAQQPQRPLHEGDPIPLELTGATILPTKDLFDSVQEPKTLRRVVNLDDNGVEEMLQHAYWLGRMKRRF